jgi:hypothetical protein
MEDMADSLVPLVVVGEDFGAVQWVGMNLKKGTQCRNAALMEYIGPKPIYCAEHIELDPNSVYCKCVCPYGKEPGDGKSCKEVVLKEFSYCYKHFSDRLASLPADTLVAQAEKDLARVIDLLGNLEEEAAAAKKQRHDLFQRKNKLVPKFNGMKKVLEEFLASGGKVIPPNVQPLTVSRSKKQTKKTPTASASPVNPTKKHLPVPANPIDPLPFNCPNDISGPSPSALLGLNFDSEEESLF